MATDRGKSLSAMGAEITPEDTFDGGAYTILWHEGEPAGFTDILPIDASAQRRAIARFLPKPL
jgi:hypothetical protein